MSQILSPYINMIIATLVTFLSSQAFAQNSTTQPSMPPELHPLFPRLGPDHVATYSSWPGRSPRDSDQIVVRRHRNLVRQDTLVIGSKRKATERRSFSNLATSASVILAYGNDRGLSAAAFFRRVDHDEQRYGNFSITKTGESEQIADMACVAWRAKPKEGEGVGYSACITYDGIVLRETTYYHDGSIMNEKRAVLVKRREVAPAEVLPDRKALDWSFWSASSTQIISPNSQVKNFTVDLSQKDRKYETSTKTLKSDGIWFSEVDRLDEINSLISVEGPLLRLSYANDRRRLDINRTDRKSILNTIYPAPLATKPERIIGEDCAWYDMAIGISDYSRWECHTHDHLPLVIMEGGRGLRRHWEATALSRNDVPQGSISPPIWLMSWTYWGWPELDTGK